MLGCYATERRFINGGPVATRSKPARDRQLQILDAAVEIIAERGIAETRIADVADRAGASAALVIYYFSTKDRLLTEALTHAEDRFYLASWHELADLPGASDRLARLIELSCPDVAETGDVGDWTLWIELWSRAIRDAEAGRKRAALDRRWRATIADIVRDGQRAGEFRRDIEPDAFAIQLAALIDGIALQIVLRDRDVSTRRGRELCMEFATSALGSGVKVDDARV
jgi:AcrR family transcriptional regulator